MRTREDLHAYQRAAVEWIVSRPRCALWLDMGLGKTAITLTALAELEQEFAFDRCLIVAPKRVALSVWKQEAANWAHTRHLEIAVAVGDARARRQAIASAAPIVVTNRDVVDSVVKESGKAWPFDMVVLDESDSFKSRSSARFRALKSVRKAIRRMVQLTGTPAPQSLLDLWAPMFLLDGGERLGRSMTAYRDRWFEADFMGWKWSPRKGAADQIHAAVADLALSMRAIDHLKMPERIDNVIRVDLPAAARKTYRKLEEEFLIELDAQLISAANAAVLVGKLQQAANGVLYTEDGEVDLHEAKLAALEEIVEGALGKPLLVAYTFRADARRIQKRFPEAVLLDENPETIAAWNRGEIPLLLFHPASAGHGLNLQAGGSTMVWYGLPWSLSLYLQACARLHRQGQKETVVIHHVTAADTVDESILRALAGKAETQTALLEAVKRDARRSA